MQELALYFHLLGVLLFVAGIVLAGVAFEAARRRRQPGEIALLLSLTRIGVLLVGAGSLLLLGFGLWLRHLEHVSAGAAWITWSSALFLLALALGGVAGQRPKRARLLATRLANEGRPASTELRTLLDDRFSLATNYISAALIIAILALMVFKP